ncbi:MAG: hypothetical protein MJE68_14910 [Proteobacteria bacterium]|nr:hypothetical protein [Pseudomonadota bacterium]
MHFKRLSIGIILPPPTKSKRISSPQKSPETPNQPANQPASKITSPPSYILAILRKLVSPP